MSFAMYILALFCSPLYFALRGRWLSAAVNGVFYLLAAFTFFLLVGVFIWLLCVAHAAWDMRSTIREREMRRQAQLIAEQQRSS